MNQGENPIGPLLREQDGVYITPQRPLQIGVIRRRAKARDTKEEG
jgi:hypothetical protein